MRKIIYLMMCLMLVSIVYSIDQPPDFDFEVASLSQPVPPSTETGGECTPFEIKDESCNGNVRHYTQCVQTASGGKYQPRSEDCTIDFSENRCFQGKCLRPEQQQAVQNNNLIIIVVVIGLIILFAVMGRKK